MERIIMRKDISERIRIIKTMKKLQGIKYNDKEEEYYWEEWGIDKDDKDN